MGLYVLSILGRLEMVNMGGWRKDSARLGVMAALLGMYGVVFVGLFPVFGPVVGALAALLVAAVGWLYGLKAGLVMGVITGVLNAVLISVMLGRDLGSVLFAAEGLPALVCLALGMAAGYMHDLTGRLGQQNEIIRRNEEGLRKNAARLRESQENYRQLFNGMLDGFALHEVIVNEDGKPADYRYLEVNPAFEEMMGLRATEIVGKTVREVEPDTKSHWISIYGETALTGTPIRFETYMSGSGKFFDVAAFSPRPQQFATIFVDITDRKRMEAAWRESEGRYWGLFENSPISLWEEDFSEVKRTIDRLRSEGVEDFRGYFGEHPEIVGTCMRMIRVVDVNQATLEMYQARSKVELIAGLDWVFSQETFGLFREELITLASGGTVFECDGQNRTLTGKKIDIHLQWSIWPGCEATAEKVIVSIADITERKRAERRVQRQVVQTEALEEISRSFLGARLEPQKIYDLIVERAAGLIGGGCLLALDLEEMAELRVVAFYHVNPQARELIGEWIEDGRFLIGEQTFRDVMSAGKGVVFEEVFDGQLAELAGSAGEIYAKVFGIESCAVLPLIEGGRVAGVLVVARGRGSEAIGEEEQAFLQNLANQAALMVDNIRMHELVKRQMETDVLTGVDSRRHFMELGQVEFALSRAEQRDLSALMLDLDHFKQVNDTYGHDVGDEVLRMVTARCRAKLRKDDLIGRFGGEEFQILLPGAGMHAAYRLAERLRQEVAEAPIVVGNLEVWVTISMGVASRTEQMEDLAALLQAADKALYAAKRGGRNRVENVWSG